MGNDYGCICSKDTGDIPVPSSDYKFESPRVIENSPMKQSIQKSQSRNINISTRDVHKITKIQAAYLKHYSQKKFSKILLTRRQQFDTNIINFAQIINNSNSTLSNYINDNVKEVEQSLIPFVPSNTELAKYHYIFDRDAYLFKNDNSIYKGNWNYNGKKHGFGIFIDGEGNKYSGFWENDKFNNRGRLIDSNGNCFEGLWKNGKANGTGVLTMKNGYRYEGNWEDDYQHGKGLEKYSDNSKYEGEYIKGVKEGRGEYTWSDGSKYIGEFENGKINGQGQFIWPDGRCYQGDWLNGQMHGKGEFTWPNGKRYVGEYKQSKKDGFGTYYWNSTTYYKGNWLNNSQHGEGTYYEDANVVKGIFRYGKLIKNESGGSVHLKGQDGMINNNNNPGGMKKTMKEYIGEGNGSIIPEVHDSFRMES